jgi:hypothetical protein
MKQKRIVDLFLLEIKIKLTSDKFHKEESKNEHIFLAA